MSTTIEEKTEDNQNQMKWSFWLGLAALVALAAAVVLGGGFLNDSDSAGETAVSAPASLPTGSGPLAVGDRPYDFTLQDLEGKSVQLAELIGRPIIINFWATWCAPCRIEMPELQATYAAHQDDGLLILALNQNESPDAVRLFFYDQLGLTFTPLLDEDSAVAERYGFGRSLPTTFFINPDGEIAVIHRGPMTQGQIEGYLEQTIE